MRKAAALVVEAQIKLPQQKLSMELYRDKLLLLGFSRDAL